MILFPSMSAVLAVPSCALFMQSHSLCGCGTETWPEIWSGYDREREALAGLYFSTCAPVPLSIMRGATDDEPTQHYGFYTVWFTGVRRRPPGRHM